MMLSLLIVLATQLCLIYGQNTLAFGNTQGSNMVLQQAPNMAKIWGNSTVGSTVTVELIMESNGQSVDKVTVTTGSNGLWSIYFKPIKASNTAYNITATSGTQSSISMTNILFGDVFVCSGQSNMQFTVDQAFNATAEVQAANNYPMIRVMTAALTGATVPQLEVVIAEKWSVAANTTIGRGNWSYFSAVCWFFGRNIYEMRKYPIGLIGTDYGGTPIRFWSSPDALKQCNESVSKPIEKQTNKLLDYKYYSNDTNIQLADSQLFNAQIYPFLQTTIKAVIWYQGESDANNPYAMEYACAFPAMIADWRLKWSQNSNTSINFPFGYVHLSTWGDSTANKTCGNNIECQYAAIVRWAQSANYGYVPNPIMPNTFMSTAVDLGDPTSPFGDIHPRYKQQVAERLAIAGMDIIYGEKNGYWQGPIVEKAVISGRNIVITFRNIGSKPMIVKNSYGFEVYDGVNSNWITTTGTVIMNGVDAVSVPIPSSVANVNDIKQVRYGWFQAPCFPDIGTENCAIGSTEWPAIPFLVNITAS
eukprot:324055_1